MNIEQLFEIWINEQHIQQQSNSKSASSHKKSFIGLRKYPHLDPGISIKQCKQRKQDFCNLEKLHTHRYWPFIRQDQNTRHYTRNLKAEQEGEERKEKEDKKGKKQKEKKNKHEIIRKTRKIMYASHYDATIFSFFAWMLKRNYEEKVKHTQLAKSVIGYRKIPINGKHNKSNIDFANDIYKHIKNANGYTVLCIDIKDFFGSINHALLKQKVAPFQGEISDEYYSCILKPITQYRYIFKEDIEEIFKEDDDWLDYHKFNRTVKSCPKLIHKNTSHKGIPQGSPISDILSNIYMYEFDQWICQEVYRYKFGLYYRYSDDIIIIVPNYTAQNLYRQIQERMTRYSLSISDKKTEAFQIDLERNKLINITSAYVDPYYKKKETIQYLGFEISLTNIAVRSRTIAKIYRKYMHTHPRKNKKNSNRSKKGKRPFQFFYEKNYNYQKLVRSKLASSTTKQFQKIRRRIAKSEKSKHSKNP